MLSKRDSNYYQPVVEPTFKRMQSNANGRSKMVFAVPKIYVVLSIIDH